MTLPLVHVVGRQGHGKTTLIEALVATLTAQGVAVGTIKHSGHDHDLDTPGKDSHRHRVAGAEPAAIVTPRLVGCFSRRAAGDDLYARLAPLYAGCQLVLVESHLRGPGPKVEVWREAVGGEPIAREQPGVVTAVISDDGAALGAVDVPVWPREPVAGLAQRLRGLAAG